MNITPNDIRYNLSILAGKEAYPSKGGIFIRAQDITSTAIEFLEIFGADIETLKTGAKEEKTRLQVKQLSEELSQVASRIYEITEFGPLPPQIPLVGPPQTPESMAVSLGGRIKTGVQKLQGSYIVRRVKGDGHCLFRAYGFGLAQHYHTTTEKPLILAHLEGLKKQYSQLTQELQTVITILETQKSPEQTATNRETSDALVAALRKLTCAYHRAHVTDVFVSELRANGDSIESYLENMSSFTKARYGSEPELRALSSLFGMNITVIDAGAQDMRPESPIYMTHIRPEEPLTRSFDNIGITLLFRTNHYDWLRRTNII